MSSFNFRFFFIFFIISFVITILTVYIFPPFANFEINLQTGKLEPKIDYTSYIIIFLSNILLNYVLLYITSKEKITILSIEEILSMQVCQTKLAKYHITHPLEICHEKYLGEFSIGHLSFCAIRNIYNNYIFFIMLCNDNFATSETKPNFTNPIIASSEKFYDAVKEAENKLLPSEKGTLTTRLKNLYKEIKEEDKEYVEHIIKNAKEKAEKEIEEEIE